MVTFTYHISLLLLLFLCATTFHISMSSNPVRCNEKDRKILLIFKQGIIDESNWLSTWSSEEDCCAWKGVLCDNTTARVIKLDLNRRGPYDEFLEGEINLSLLQLEFLNYLDLSFNSFDKISVPALDENVTLTSYLHHLDLSRNGSPHLDNLQWLTRLSSLRYLDLRFIHLRSETNSLEMVALLPNLHHLDLSFVKGLDVDNLEWLTRLSSLRYLGLQRVDLHKETNWLQTLALLPSLSELYLSECKLENISPSLKYVNFTSLTTLDLSENNFNSKLPNWLFNLKSDLSYLNLYSCSLHGELPSNVPKLLNLTTLDLSKNQLTGLIPDWIGQLEHLELLDLSHNLFSGAISETLFSKLSNLNTLDLSDSTLAFNFDTKWNPPFQLGELYLANTNQGPNFPSWIYTQKSLYYLDMSSTGISSVNGDMFWRFVGEIDRLYLSNNSISGDISNVTLCSTDLALDHNNFTGRLPKLSANSIGVELSHNSFSGPMPSGWENWKDLSFMSLWGNRLSGELPMDLSNLTILLILNLGMNEFIGPVPIKMPESIEVLILRSNQLEGNIPPQLFNLSSLYYLDLAHNQISGTIPQHVYNMTRMMTDDYGISFLAFRTNFDWFTKGQDYESQVDSPRPTIDFSVNNLSGEIPLGLFSLIKVHTLNLSYNHFSGRLEKAIGDMANLESLDLSNNELFGEIPQSIASLTFLGYLNLSFNDFVGQIPIGTQLQSFNASSYIGNPELCGAPLSKCISVENPENVAQLTRNEDGDPERESLYLGMGVGFAVGFWGSCGSLFFNKRWRHTFFRFFNKVADLIFVTSMIRLNRFRKSQT